MENMYAQLVGQVIDRYKVISVLGEGGMGAVLKGHDVTLQRDVAIKLMHPHLASQPNFQERFLQEARTAARLDHPNIVQVFTFGQFRSMMYIIMEFIPGDNLEQMLSDLRAENKWMLLREALESIRQIALALDYAHRNGVLHRDLKPSNIMIEPVPSEGLPYRPVITDLGLAKLASGGLHTQEGTSMGTPAYMSPEQALGKESDPRSDVYSLGVMLFELCTGQLPFKARTLTEAIRCHTQEMPPRPRSIRPDLPEMLDVIILKTLEKDPNKRFPNAAGLAQALQSIPTTDQVFQASPTAMEKAVSLITQYKKSLDKPRGPSVLEEFKTPPGITRDMIQILTPDQKTHDVPLKTGGMTIGRDPDNDIVLDEPLCSRKHVRIDVEGSQVRIVDLNSTNGTFLGNVRLLAGVAEEWTEDKALRIGKIWLRLRRGQSETTERGNATRADMQPVVSGGDSGRVGVSVGKAQLTVEPGSSLTLPVTLQNQGALVDRFNISVRGIPTSWLTEPEKIVPMMPGDQKEISLVIRPPRSAQSRAGRHSLTLVVASQQNVGKPVEVGMTLTVSAYTQFSSEMRPQKIRPKQACRVEVRNLGNAQETYTIQPKDRGDELAFTPPTAQVRVAEGQTGEAIFYAAPRRRRWLGAEKSFPFTAQVLPQKGDPQAHSGELVHKPPLPAWVLPIPLVLCLLLTAVGGLIWTAANSRIAAQTATVQAIETDTAVQVNSIIQTRTAEAVNLLNANQATRDAATATAVWNAADDDRDGLTNAQELELNTLPNKRDTDEDGLDDGDEVNNHKTDPLKPDTDNDGLKDGMEVSSGLNPLNTDTDGDGVADAADVDPKNKPTLTPTVTATATATPTVTPTPTATEIVLSEPVLVSPNEGEVFNIFPRTTTLRWNPVAGAAFYRLERDFVNSGAACPQGEPNYDLAETNATEFTFNFVGAQPGCWRVWAVGPGGVEGPKSPWRTFRYTQ